MANTRKLGQWRPDPTVDLGLGYCYRCIQFMAVKTVDGKADELAGFVANFACTLAPWPMGGQVLELPACFPCQIGEGTAGKPGSGLIRANGKVPGL